MSISYHNEKDLELAIEAAIKNSREGVEGAIQELTSSPKVPYTGYARIGSKLYFGDGVRFYVDSIFSKNNLDIVPTKLEVSVSNTFTNTDSFSLNRSITGIL